MKVGRTGFFVVATGIVCTMMMLFAASCTPDEQANSTDKVSTQTADEPVARTEYKVPRFTANQFCAACHADFSDDPFAAMHEKAGIGCERCHGESERHRSDEDNITPPELMFPPSRINPTCMMCHPRQDIEKVSFHKKLLEGADTIFDEDTEEESDSPRHCTDCHAKGHKMKVRTIQWNKATGEMLD